MTATTKARWLELLAVTMIGDGVLGVVQPHRHVALWRRGPAAWRAMFDIFAERPALTRCFGAAETAFGLWLAAQQHDRRLA